MNIYLKSVWYTLFVMILCMVWVEAGNCQLVRTPSSIDNTFLSKVELSKSGFSLKKSNIGIVFENQSNLIKTTFSPVELPVMKQVDPNEWKANKWQDLRNIYYLKHKIFNELIQNRKRLNLA